MKLSREKPGVLADCAIWVLSYGCWLHLHRRLHKLIWEALTEWKDDRHIVG